MLVRRCLMGALVGMSGGFLVGLISAFVLGSIGFMLSEEGAEPAIDILTWDLLLSIPTGTIIGIVVAIRKHKRRQAIEAEEEEEAQSRR